MCVDSKVRAQPRDQVKTRFFRFCWTTFGFA